MCERISSCNLLKLLQSASMVGTVGGRMSTTIGELL